MVEVTKEDREAAVEIYRAIRIVTKRDAENILAGEWDATEHIQRIAQCRQSTHAAKDAEIEALRAEVGRLREALRLYDDDQHCGLCERFVSSGEAARAALRDPQP